jgi:uncharacterized protein YgiM (DUF1202 family)
MRQLTLLILLCQLLYASAVQARGEHRELTVQDPYIEMHTGPGRGYPIFYVAERGESIAVLRRRTDWYQVRGPRGEQGWVPSEQLERTLELDGQQFEAGRSTLEDYAGRRWEAGVSYGDFGGANVISMFGSYSLTGNLSFELSLSEALGRYSDSVMTNLNIVHAMFPERRASPYFTLGAGTIHTEPKATLIATVDRTDSLAHAGFGVRTYLTRRFVFRAEYKTYVVFTSRDDNEEIREWKAGFSFFF